LIPGVALTALTTMGITMGVPKMTADATPDPQGCARLLEVSAQLCSARVSCPEETQLLDRARALYARCAAGQPVSPDEVDALFGAFGSPLIYRCCIGNALHQAHTGQ